MKFLSNKEARKLKPSPHYAKIAAILRERGLEVEDDDREIIDMTIRECNRLLDLRSLLGRLEIKKAGVLSDGPLLNQA
jgi:hypothetical protein